MLQAGFRDDEWALLDFSGEPRGSFQVNRQKTDAAMTTRR
jgi:hypothetical protein